MEINENKTESNTLTFIGKGIDLLGILLINGILNVLTLTLYYPWARVKQIKFFWEHTSLNGTPFKFTGTGEEIFKGYIRFFLLLIFLYALLIYSQFSGNMMFNAIVGLSFSAFIFMVIPLAMHGAFRYRLSRTSWRGIHFGYRGDRTQLFIDFILGYFLMIVTLGIYYNWFVNKIRTYIIGHIRFGSLHFSYNGTGFDLFIIQLKGTVLTFLTLGIYYFWFYKEWLNYLIDHCRIHQDDKTYTFRSNASGMDVLSLLLGNFFILILTLGIGYAWTLTRTTSFIIEHIVLPQDIQFDQIEQTENEYKDATGEYVFDYLDIGII